MCFPAASLSFFMQSLKRFLCPSPTFLPGEFLPILEAPSHLLLCAFPDSLRGHAYLLP